MKLDSNLAWKQAVAAITANREVAGAIAGVFFMLPSLAFALLFPQPDPPPAGMTGEQAMKIVSDFYLSAAPWLIPVVILQTIGSIAVLVLFTDRSKPTVGEAIKLGFAGVLPYLGSQLLLGLGVGLAGAVLVGIAAATGMAALAVVAVIAVVAAMIYASLRVSLVAPVIAVERTMNPVAALRRSWDLTKGNAGRIFLFVLLLAIAFLVVTMVISGIVGAVATLALGVGSASEAIIAIVSSALGAAFTLYMMAAVGAIHHQLSGGGDGAVAAAFD